MAVRDGTPSASRIRAISRCTVRVLVRTRAAICRSVAPARTRRSTWRCRSVSATRGASLMLVTPTSRSLTVGLDVGDDDGPGVR